MHKLFSIFSFLAATVTARNLNILTQSNSTIYAESKACSDAFGFYFALTNNVLQVMINGTNIGSCPEQFMIMPQLLLEYNSTIDANSTQSRYGFMSKSGDITDWGKGLVATKYQSQGQKKNVDVWMISANWTNPSNSDGGKTDAPKFHARMYIASGATTFEGMELTDNAIQIVYSILDYPFKLKSSSLGYNQIVLSASNITTTNNTEIINTGCFGGGLRINSTCLVDGKAQNVTIAPYDNTSIDIIAGNSTDINVASWAKQSIFLGFNNSGEAKNVTFEQRLAINVTNLNCDKNLFFQSAALMNAPSIWMALFIVFVTMAVTLPIVLL